jgi:hypothetical protein
MDNLDLYALQAQRQNHGLTCEYCGFALGHKVTCFLLSTSPRELVLTGPNFDEQKYKPTDRVLSAETVQSIDDAVAAVAKYSRSGSPRKVELVPTKADHLRLRSLGVVWEGDKR